MVAHACFGAFPPSLSSSDTSHAAQAGEGDNR